MKENAFENSTHKGVLREKREPSPFLRNVR